MSSPSDSATRGWLITGANSGFGAAFTRAALAAGDAVVAAVRRPGTMAELAAAHPDRLTVVALDVADAEACQRAVHAAESALGRIDVLVNNAGFGTVGALEETTEDELRHAMEVMFFGPMRLTRLALPGMRRRRGGAIVQLTSMGGLLAFAGVGTYAAAKGALEQASEALAAEVGPLGIRVLIVEPGAFRTEFNGAIATAAPLPDYAATVRVIRDNLAAADGRQPGDPAKAARALLATLALPDPPLRLPLGDDAVTAIRAKLARVEGDITATAHLGTGPAINFP
ncbi:SDR family NAD(P)-dependent oxidoreductase [Streptomyces radicis]|uniref:SDR family NAD(P)-dependent oxidoreductase n=1 Tax=Streptomyces radicis TaxID=1750517 RepID=A0A3A9WW18_9ACTN|nr:SDR family NAD(P)-dependent oxidoreductase [Streptomyces radicis]RKN12006.1 SDR family NAD(P)-dependent oxidoreductase [Streptomyces radicis]RKN25943.1 SDR family NAD(P)-dependent oxidoreductase [Streptomyces radicis]